MRSLPLALLGLLAVTGCDRDNVFECASDVECMLPDLVGTCEPTNACSFPDSSCPSGDRYGEFAPPDLADQCVEVDVAVVTARGDLTHDAPEADDRALVVLIAVETTDAVAVDDSVAAVTYGGQPLDRLAQHSVTGGGSVNTVQVWAIAEAGLADASSSDIELTLDASLSPNDPHLASLFLSGVDQDVIIGSTVMADTPSETQLAAPPLDSPPRHLAVLIADAGELGSYTSLNGFERLIAESGSSHSSIVASKLGTGEEIPEVRFTGTFNRQLLLGVAVQPAE